MSRKAIKKPATDGGFVARSITLPKEVDAMLMAYAKREERSLSNVVARAVREFIEKAEKSKK